MGEGVIASALWREADGDKSVRRLLKGGDIPSTSPAKERKLLMQTPPGSGGNDSMKINQYEQLNSK